MNREKKTMREVPFRTRRATRLPSTLGRIRWSPSNPTFIQQPGCPSACHGVEQHMPRTQKRPVHLRVMRQRHTSPWAVQPVRPRTSPIAAHHIPQNPRRVSARADTHRKQTPRRNPGTLKAVWFSARSRKHHAGLMAAAVTSVQQGGQKTAQEVPAWTSTAGGGGG